MLLLNPDEAKLKCSRNVDMKNGTVFQPGKSYVKIFMFFAFMILFIFSVFYSHYQTRDGQSAESQVRAGVAIGANDRRREIGGRERSTRQQRGLARPRAPSRTLANGTERDRELEISCADQPSEYFAPVVGACHVPSYHHRLFTPFASLDSDFVFWRRLQM